MVSVNVCKILSFKEFGDSRGNLIALEGNKEIPFDIKRIFYVYNMDQNVVRGQHANRNSSFVLICVNGSCSIKVCDGIEEIVVELDSPNKGLYIPRMLWKDMYNFSENAVLLCFSDCAYDSEEYITDFRIFKNSLILE